jgi:hypothetical protein
MSKIKHSKRVKLSPSDSKRVKITASKGIPIKGVYSHSGMGKRKPNHGLIIDAKTSMINKLKAEIKLLKKENLKIKKELSDFAKDVISCDCEKRNKKI